VEASSLSPDTISRAKRLLRGQNLWFFAFKNHSEVSAKSMSRMAIGEVAFDDDPVLVMNQNLFWHLKAYDDLRPRAK
jgi:hypothetical protein